METRTASESILARVPASAAETLWLGGSWVATELPASQSVVASDAGARTSDSAPVRVSISTASVSNQVVIDRDARSVVYQVVDNRTSQVVKQFPEEAVLRRRAYFHTLDLTKDAPQRLSATDRKA